MLSLLPPRTQQPRLLLFLPSLLWPLLLLLLQVQVLQVYYSLWLLLLNRTLCSSFLFLLVRALITIDLALNLRFYLPSLFVRMASLYMLCLVR